MFYIPFPFPFAFPSPVPSSLQWAAAIANVLNMLPRNALTTREACHRTHRRKGSSRLQSAPPDESSQDKWQCHMPHAIAASYRLVGRRFAAIVWPFAELSSTRLDLPLHGSCRLDSALYGTGLLDYDVSAFDNSSSFDWGHSHFGGIH